MVHAEGAEVLIVSLGSTAGLRRADEELRDSLARAGVSVSLVRARPPARARTLMLTDLLWARAARDAVVRFRRQSASRPVQGLIYSSTTAALLWPSPGAIRFDATSAANRPGRHGLWQRPLERRRLRQAPLLLPWSEGGLLEAPPAARRGDRALVLPVAVEPSAASGGRPPGSASEPGAPAAGRAPDSAPGPAVRDIAAVTYAANPAKKGLDRVLRAWRGMLAARRSPSGEVPSGEELVIAGASAAELERGGLLARGEPGVRVAGTLAPGDYRALLRRARIFICAPRREDYGIAQLEALADGCMLVTTAAPGPYAALAIASELDERLVGEDLQGAIRVALDDPRPDYSVRARRALAPFGRDAVDRLVAVELLPRLLA